MAELVVQIHSSIAQIGRIAWDSLNDGNPFTSYTYLHALELSGCLDEASGWQIMHLSVSDGDGIKGVMPLYLKYHSQGEYVFDHGWAEAFERAGGHYYPKLLCASPFTPVGGIRLLSDNPEIRTAMLAAVKQICDQNQLSSVHIIFTNESQWNEMGDHGFLLRKDKQFWWENSRYANFDDFLNALSASRRKVIKRERRDVLAQLQIKTILGADINETHMDQMYDFIRATYDKKWGAPYLTRDFFSQILATMRDKIVLFFAYDGGEAIAGAINFIGDNVLYGRQWGCMREVPFLHFELCYYQAIEFAISGGIKRVEAGTQGHHKLSRGYLPHPTYSAHYIRDIGLRNAVANFLEKEREAIENQILELRENGSPYRQKDPL